jgi:fatty-acyl-CoA synthase
MDDSWIHPSAADAKLLSQAKSHTLWQLLTAAAALDPAKTALVFADDEGRIERLTYGELITRIRNFSAGLASIGIKRGDRVVLWMTNRLEWIVSAFAAARIGAVTVPINTFLKIPEVAYCLAQSRADHLIMLDKFRNLDMREMLAEIAPELRNVVMFRREGLCLEGAHDWSTLEATGGEWLDQADTMAAAVTPDDLHMIKYTSGSTGFPKGVMLQQGGWAAIGLLHGQRTGMAREDVYFSMMPFFHAGGSMYGQMSMLSIGGTLVFTEAFSVDLAVELLQSERATIFISVLGKEVVQAAHGRGIAFPSVWLGHVFNDLAREVLPNARFAFSPYGLTETYGPACLTGPDDPANRQGVTSGRPLPGNTVRVVDPLTGLNCPAGAIGEGWLRGNLMAGYWDKPEETAAMIDSDGWLHSEDLISVDAQGYVTYQGRLKLMAKVGGENVSLEEVERVALGHAAITHCAAVGVADMRKVETVRLYAVLQDALVADELRAWLKPRLAHFKLPRDIVFVEALPRLGNGKLDRAKLGQWAKEELAA